MTIAKAPTVSLKDLPGLKKAYANCEEEIFTYNGHKLLKSYARYLIEYLEGLK